MDKQVDLEPLRIAIRKHRMMMLWKYGVLSESESPEEHASKKAMVAKRTFEQIMCSPKNDGSNDYLEWAINTALNLKTTRGHSAQAIGGKNWKSWGGK